MAKSTANRRLGKATSVSAADQPTPIQPSRTKPKPSTNTAKATRSGEVAVSYVLYGLLLASLFTPLVFSTTSFFGFVSERGLFFRVIVAAMAIVSLLKPGFLSSGWSWLQLSVLAVSE